MCERTGEMDLICYTVVAISLFGFTGVVCERRAVIRVAVLKQLDLYQSY